MSLRTISRPLQRNVEDASKEDRLDELLTIKEVARCLRVDHKTVRHWIKIGALDAIILPHRGERQAYRVKKSTLDALLEIPGRTEGELDETPGRF